MVPKQNFEQFLLENQLIGADNLKVLQADAQSRKVTLYQVLVEKNIFTNETLAQTLAKYFQLEHRPMPLKFDVTLAAKFPHFTLRRYRVFPLEVDDKQKEIVVAVVDPGNFLATDEIKRLAKMNVRAVVTTEAAISEAITRLTGAVGKTDGSAPTKQLLDPKVKKPERKLASAPLTALRPLLQSPPIPLDWPIRFWSMR